MKRKRFKEEQIVAILKEAEAGKTVGDICRAYGISEQTYYRWKKMYGGLRVSEVRRLHDLEKENARLKRLMAERDLEIDALKEWISKNG